MNFIQIYIVGCGVSGFLAMTLLMFPGYRNWFHTFIKNDLIEHNPNDQEILDMIDEEHFKATSETMYVMLMIIFSWLGILSQIRDIFDWLKNTPAK